MKRLLALFLLCGLLTGGIFSANTAFAQDSAPDSGQLDRIRTNCVDVKSRLNQLHTADTLLRVNRGQLYEQILTKLMSPFNSRVALNNLNSVNLVADAAQYQQQLMAFRADYQQYEESLSAAIKIDCTTDPTGFYAQIEDARTKRSTLHDSTVALTKTIDMYRNTFVDFRKNYLGENQ
ncbi:MAG TPA: hypothetical protein VJ841_03065 [Candidatus Saccharimonadales bacterium]|nr:hypothetical protein [Candidatus Saccharimonadales bacterium]